MCNYLMGRGDLEHGILKKILPEIFAASLVLVVYNQIIYLLRNGSLNKLLTFLP